MTSPASWSDDLVLARVKRTLVEDCGIRAFADAARLFRHFDANGNGTISACEFRAGLASVGCKLSEFETKYLVLAFDKNRDGKIDLEEFVGELVYPQMNRRRQRVVVAAYESLCARSVGGAAPTAAEVRAAFDVSRHPEVRAGIVPARTIEREFAATFGDDVCSAGPLSLDVFKALFAGVSTVVPSDDVFDELVTLGFHVDADAKPTFSGSTRDWSKDATAAGGKDPLEYTPHRPDDAWRRPLIALQRTKGYDLDATWRPQPDREPALNKECPRTWETSSRAAWVNHTAKK